MDLEAFGGRLKELREQAGLTQQQLADRAGLSLRGVSQWERGVREPGWGSVLALADALGVNCLAFQQAPAPRPEAGPGRPRKAEEPPAPKRPRGRPKKDATAEGSATTKGKRQ